MCGIAGIFAYRDPAPPVDRVELVRVRDAMAARGPDGEGLWISKDGRVGLAHRRLAIIDLSDAGLQPMSTADSRLHITFNGEIYNYRELRKELEHSGHQFRTQSDTEVLLQLYAERGSRMVEDLRGMFALAIWDEREQELFLARDPFGIKPLYYADDGRTVRFASQVKALAKSEHVDLAPEPAGSVGFLIWGHVPEPFTLHRGIRSVPSGAHIRIARNSSPARTQYFVIRNEFRRAEEGSAISASSEVLHEALEESVRYHLVSDVPVGIFLSAGIDSSAVAAIAAKQQGGNLTALTLGFPEFKETAQDEVPIAKTVASHLGINHVASWASRQDFEHERRRILDAMDQPSIDGVNTYLIAQAASRAGMKVALSGLGGDELFGGYPSFWQVPRAANFLGFTRIAPFLGPLVRRLLSPVASRFTSPKYAGLLEYGSSYASAYLLRRALFMPWEVREILDEATVAAGLEKLLLVENLRLTIEGLSNPRSRIAALELSWYMRNQLLRDADWAGMAHSLEIRVPLIDAQLFRKIAPLIVSTSYPTKKDLAAAAGKMLPQVLTSRSKTGFVTPVREWIANSPQKAAAADRGLRDWARTILPVQPHLFRALVLLTDAYGGEGGIAKFNRDLLGAMAAMPECAEVVAIPRLVPAPLHPIPPNVRFVSRAASKGKLRFMYTAFIEATSGPYDLVVAAHINLATLGKALALLKGAPSLLVIHGIDAWKRHSDFLVRKSLRYFTAIVGVSHLTLERFSAWAPVRESQFMLLPNCFDPEIFTAGPRSEALARRLGVENRTIIMTLGRLASEERYKGFDEIIEALPRLVEDIPDIVYLICGDGPDRARLEKKALDLGVGKQVVFTGFVPEARKPEYYRLADAYVMPSKGEGFGIVLLEAMACGIPTLASRVDGSREALLGGKLGRLVDPSNPEEIIEGVRATIAAGRGVPRDLTHYSRDAFIQRAEAIVRNTLNKPRRADAYT